MTQVFFFSDERGEVLYSIIAMWTVVYDGVLVYMNVICRWRDGSINNILYSPPPPPTVYQSSLGFFKKKLKQERLQQR